MRACILWLIYNLDAADPLVNWNDAWRDAGEFEP